MRIVANANPNSNGEPADAAESLAEAGTRLTDAGNALRLIARRGRDLRYCAATGKWLLWYGHKWTPDNAGQIIRWAKESAAALFGELANADPSERRELYAHAKRSESAKGIRDAIQLAECELGVRPDQLDADGMLLGVANGVVDLRHGTLQPHQREDLITRSRPCRSTLTRLVPFSCDSWIGSLMGTKN